MPNSPWTTPNPLLQVKKHLVFLATAVGVNGLSHNHAFPFGGKIKTSAGSHVVVDRGNRTFEIIFKPLPANFRRLIHFKCWKNTWIRFQGNYFQRECEVNIKVQKEKLTPVTASYNSCSTWVACVRSVDNANKNALSILNFSIFLTEWSCSLAYKAITSTVPRAASRQLSYSPSGCLTLWPVFHAMVILVNKNRIVMRARLLKIINSLQKFTRFITLSATEWS